MATNNWEIDSDNSVKQLQLISVFSLTDEPPILNLVDSNQNNLCFSIENTIGNWTLKSTGTLDYTGSNPEDVEFSVFDD